MTCEEVNDFDNLVVLCLFHALEVDEHVNEHPTELLEDWKSQQHDDAQILGTTVELTDDELLEAVQVVAHSNVSSAALVELAKAAQAMRSGTERNRRQMNAVCARRDAAIAQLQQSMAGRMWSTETGEAIDTSGARLSGNEEKQHRSAMLEALNQANSELEPALERVLEEAAGVAAAINCPAGLEEWIKRAAQDVLAAATTWDTDAEDPDLAVRTALDELDQAVTAFKRSAAGAAVDIPPPPEPPVEAEPTATDVFIADYTEFYEGALRFVRVEHLLYEEPIHNRLLEACPTLLGAPDSPHFMTRALTATQNAVLSAAVCRNATDDEFNDVIAPRLQQLIDLPPEAVAALHIGYLRERCAEDGNEDRVAKLDDLLASLGQHVINELGEPSFWERNQWYGGRAASAALFGAGEDDTIAAITAALNTGCTEGILLAFAPVTDSMDSDTMRYQQTKRSYRRSGFPIFPDWFPTSALVYAVREHQDTLSTDEAKELAAQLLANPQVNGAS